MPSWVVVAMVRGGEPSMQRAAMDRRDCGVNLWGDPAERVQAARDLMAADQQFARLRLPLIWGISRCNRHMESRGWRDCPLDHLLLSSPRHHFQIPVDHRRCRRRAWPLASPLG